MAKENTNWYKYVRKGRQYHNPNYHEHFIEIPFRALIIGASGSGKTTSAIELLHRMSNTFNTVIICCKSSCEPLYDYLRSRIPDDMLSFYENGEYPDEEELKQAGQTLMIFDDLVLEKNQDRIGQFFIRGRKIGDGISCVYLTQSYFTTPKIIRQQCNYILFKDIKDKRDINLILNEWSMGNSTNEVMKLYRRALKKKNVDFFMIDLATIDPRYTFRRNFTPIADVQ